MSATVLSSVLWVVPEEKNPPIENQYSIPFNFLRFLFLRRVELADAERNSNSDEICFGVGRFYSPITVLLLSFTFSLALFQHPSNANPPEAAQRR